MRVVLSASASASPAANNELASPGARDYVAAAARQKEYVNPALPLHPDVIPYSCSTGIAQCGQEEIAGYLRSLRTQGFCVIERVIPDDKVDAVRESVREGHRLIKSALPHGTWSVVPKDSPDYKLSEDGFRPIHPPVVNEITFNPLYRKYLIEPRMLAVAKAMLDTHVRISQTETHKQRGANSPHVRSWHSDWPHDLSAYGPNDEEPWRHCGAIRQPFPDVCMALSTVWYLGPDHVGSHNGGTWIVPRSHKDPRNPRGPDDGIDEREPIPGELQCHCPAGSVFVQDTRSWHSNAANLSEFDRVAVVCRYVPWWLSSKEFGSGPCRTFIPNDVFTTFPLELQHLYRHLAEGVDDYLQPENQIAARRAMFQDQPHLRGETRGDNSHVKVGAMSAKQWLMQHDKARL